MHARADIFRSGFAENLAHRCLKFRVMILFGNAETARQIVRTDQNRINVGNFENRVEIVDRGLTFDVQNQ